MIKILIYFLIFYLIIIEVKSFYNRKTFSKLRSFIPDKRSKIIVPKRLYIRSYLVFLNYPSLNSRRTVLNYFNHKNVISMYIIQKNLNFEKDNKHLNLTESFYNGIYKEEYNHNFLEDLIYNYKKNISQKIIDNYKKNIFNKNALCNYLPTLFYYFYYWNNISKIYYRYYNIFYFNNQNNNFDYRNKGLLYYIPFSKRR